MAIADNRNMRIREKIRATVTRRVETYAIATDANGNEYFLNYSCCEQMGKYEFEDLVMGSKIKLTPIEDPGRGLRAIEVEIVEL